ncbi:sigma-70 family RNA polymerase sigma factor [Oculatella sp. LEGE 06141]|uniref:sigma-70 family RNA polymerase sigma factor n=1 Tax=Oculatella sp. LEGE 06141 TaxID=1828648 RepID=UPI001882E468|nr:sigma-70 family RNA polymerase sigma factor [Oculatella sp. LEGE 06141]MBE9180204.1 sigma-70 family RNA polymerase sigma factor [Oculatella sp. LEGE 06141]
MFLREELLEVFSTFLQFDDVCQKWITDPKLRRNMQAAIRSNVQERSQDFWALYWYKQWEAENAENLVAKEHLNAYVQETCFWVARKTEVIFDSQYTVSDYFQIAISRFDKILHGFKETKGYKFKNYALVAFRNTIRDFLIHENEVSVLHDWALLRRSSKKRLITALKQHKQGCCDADIARYVLAWSCFMKIYSPDVRTKIITTPNKEQWKAIADLYSYRCKTELFSIVTIDPLVLEDWMRLCAEAIRSGFSPKFISIYELAPVDRSKTEFVEVLDQLTSTDQALPLDLISVEEEEEERQQQRMFLNSVLLETLNCLDRDSRSLLALYYQEGLLQQQISSLLNMNQSTVSRRLERIRRSFLIALIQRGEDHLHISNDSTVLERVGAAIEEWLHIHFAPSTDHPYYENISP